MIYLDHPLVHKNLYCTALFLHACMHKHTQKKLLPRFTNKKPDLLFIVMSNDMYFENRYF